MTQVVNKNFLALVTNHEAADDFCDKVMLEGGARSGKTWSVFDYLILCGEWMPGLVMTCFRKDRATHSSKGGNIDSFKTICATRYPKVWRQGFFHETTKVFYHKNGSVLEFAGSNEPDKQRGPERDIAFFNEATEQEKDAYEQISLRTRVMEIFDWNPSLSIHWVYELMKDTDHCLHVKSNFRDNPHLSPKQVAKMLSYEPTPENLERGTADRYLWEVFGLGKRSRPDGAIFQHFEVTDFWPERHLCLRHGYGMDFGFTLDPSTMVECALYNNELYLREVFYETNLLTTKNVTDPLLPSIQLRLEEAARPDSKLKFDRNRARIVADSASPKDIADLRACGYSITGAEKFPGCIQHRIKMLKRFRINVHRSSRNLQLEIEQYKNRQLRDGTWIDEPDDRCADHAIDAVGYWAQENLQAKQLDTPARKKRRSGRKTSTGLRRY